MRAFLLLLFSMGASAQITAPQVPLTGTLGPGGIFPILNSGTLIFTDANQTMGYPATSAAVIKLTSSVLLTATRTLIAPLGLGFTYTFFNDTSGGQQINVCGASGTCAAVPHDSYPHLVSTDGTNYYTVASSVGVTGVSVAAANGLQGSSSGGASPTLTLGPDGSHCIPSNTGSASIYLNGACAYTIPSTGVSGIIPGTNVTCAPFVSGTCVGAVTVNSSGGYSLGGTLSNSNIVAATGTGITSITVTGLDGNHRVTLTTGSSGAPAGPLWTLTFTNPRPSVTYPVMQSGQIYSVYSTGGSTISYTAVTSGGLSALTSYTFDVSCP